MPTEQPSRTIGVILAGGLARRMGGGDKPMWKIQGITILEHVLRRLSDQCDGIILNANGDPSRFGSFGLPVVEDDVKDNPGPLAGILAGLDWTATHQPDAEWIVSVAGDCPFLPRDLVRRLQEARTTQQTELAVASSGGQVHPVNGLWRVALRHKLRQALVEEEIRKIDRWTGRYRMATVSWPRLVGSDWLTLCRFGYAVIKCKLGRFRREPEASLGK
jgi:molybdopterin-guanine dinucleotide biosynthesis protein A